MHDYQRGRVMMLLDPKPTRSVPVIILFSQKVPSAPADWPEKAGCWAHNPSWNSCRNVILTLSCCPCGRAGLVGVIFLLVLYLLIIMRADDCRPKRIPSDG